MINNKSLSQVYISNSFKDTKFTITIPGELTEKNNIITITSDDFYLPSISNIIITKENEQLEQSNFNVKKEENKITITMDYESKKVYKLVSIEKEKDNDENAS